MSRNVAAPRCITLEKSCVLRARPRIRVVLFLLALPVLLLPPLQAELLVSFEPRAVTATGVTPAGSVALLAVAKTPATYFSRMTYVRELLTDRDGDGTVAFEFDAEIPVRSLWVFVDVATGEYAVAAPDDEVRREVEFPLEDSMRDDIDGGYVLVDDRRASLEVLYVRPRESGWHSAATDGGLTDRDGSADGRLKVALEDLRELGGGSREVSEVATGDILVGIDPHLGEFFVLEVDAGRGSARRGRR